MYLDGVSVYSPDFDSHLAHLDIVFSKLRQDGLKLKPGKCELCQQQVCYFGHIMEEQGTSPDPEKLRVVREFGGYYRCFVTDFSKTTAPLHNLLVGIPRQGQQTVQ